MSQPLYWTLKIAKTEEEAWGGASFGRYPVRKKLTVWWLLADLGGEELRVVAGGFDPGDPDYSGSATFRRKVDAEAFAHGYLVGYECPESDIDRTGKYALYKGRNLYSLRPNNARLYEQTGNPRLLKDYLGNLMDYECEVAFQNGANAAVEVRSGQSIPDEPVFRKKALRLYDPSPIFPCAIGA